jgi:hypothetical protein
LTDARVAIVKGALQLTPEQEKHWAAVEEAIRARATGRQARAAKIAARADELRDRNAIEVLRDRNPIEFMRRHADALAQRAAEFKRLADGWEPLYETLNAEQKRRLGLVGIFVVREMRDEVEEHLLEDSDDDQIEVGRLLK